MLPLYLLLMVFAVFSNISIRLANSSQLWYAHTMAGTSILTFVIGIIAVCLMTLVIMVSRFHSNLLGEQGYLMLTLPTTIHKLILSKAFTSIVWFGASFLACGLAVYIQGFDSYTFEVTLDFIDALIFILRDVDDGTGAILAQREALVLLVELILLAGLCLVAFTLFVYASMAIGHSFSSRKVLLSFAAFFGMNFILQTMGTGVFAFLVENDTNLGDFFGVDTFFQGMQLMLGIGAFIAIALAAVFYGITWYMMKKLLNLH